MCNYLQINDHLEVPFLSPFYRWEKLRFKEMKKSAQFIELISDKDYSSTGNLNPECVFLNHRIMSFPPL